MGVSRDCCKVLVTHPTVTKQTQESAADINIKFACFVYPPTAASSPTSSVGVPAESAASEASAEVAGTPPEQQMTRYAERQVRLRWF